MNYELKQTIYIKVEKAGINDDGKITCEKGSFYWNGKQYNIEKGEIKCC